MPLYKKVILNLFLITFCVGNSLNLEDWNNDNISWIREDWSQALEIAKNEHKPLMVLIKRKSCNACKALRTKFIINKEIEILSESFVMVITEASNKDSNEFDDDLFRPDGDYFPRILFFSPEGKLLKDVIRLEATQNLYFHYEMNEIADTMRAVSQKFAENIDNEEQDNTKSEL